MSRSVIMRCTLAPGSPFQTHPMVPVRPTTVPDLTGGPRDPIVHRPPPVTPPIPSIRGSPYHRRRAPGPRPGVPRTPCDNRQHVVTDRLRAGEDPAAGRIGGCHAASHEAPSTVTFPQRPGLTGGPPAAAARAVRCPGGTHGHGGRGRMSASPAGRVRLARLTDLAALGELSRLSHRADEADASVRSLGLPVQASHVSVFRLFRMPLGAFQPHDPLYVYDQEGRLAGLARADRDTQRDEWTIVELDAVDQGDAGDIRFRLVNHLLRDGSKRGATRFHVACADEDANVELFMQAGFARYGEETHPPPQRTTSRGRRSPMMPPPRAWASGRPCPSTRCRSTRSTAP